MIIIKDLLCCGHLTALLMQTLATPVKKVHTLKPLLLRLRDDIRSNTMVPVLRSDLKTYE